MSDEQLWELRERWNAYWEAVERYRQQRRRHDLLHVNVMELEERADFWKWHGRSGMVVMAFGVSMMLLCAWVQQNALLIVSTVWWAWVLAMAFRATDRSRRLAQRARVKRAEMGPEPQRPADPTPTTGN